MASRKIVVVGAGVTGLTTALLLSQDKRNVVTIVAKHMPGDYDIEYASMWAGANYMPVSINGTEAMVWDKNTWPELDRLARTVPEAGIHFQRTEIYNRKKDVNSATGAWFAELLSVSPWFKDVVPDFAEIPKEQLDKVGPGIDSGQCLKNGVVFERAVFKHISDAALAHHSGQKADLVVNCTGLMACKLGGVKDNNVIPARGQIILVRNDPGIMCSISGTDDGDDEVIYIMKRAAGGGTILGGCYQKGNWESTPDPNLAIRIMKRCVELCPALTNGKGIEALDIIRHGVGLRPLRLNGTRIEKERLDGTWIVHNYGHGGFGYQSSYGCSQAAVKLVEEALTQGPKL